jgi:hypothetical protein
MASSEEKYNCMLTLFPVKQLKRKHTTVRTTFSMIFIRTPAHHEQARIHQNETSYDVIL